MIFKKASLQSLCALLTPHTAWGRGRAASLLQGAGFALRASLAGQLERGVLLPGVDDVQNLDALKRDAVDQHVVWMGHQLASA
ncbi:hypothetical protein AL054_25570 [Pseudomonas amygdali pv. morsprunorum]|nr:hypothetical protein AL054_25570 [Pseudomonas amygdali pv. morsprunorum]